MVAGRGYKRPVSRRGSGALLSPPAHARPALAMRVHHGEGCFNYKDMSSHRAEADQQSQRRCDAMASHGTRSRAAQSDALISPTPLFSTGQDRRRPASPPADSGVAPTAAAMLFVVARPRRNRWRELHKGDRRKRGLFLLPTFAGGKAFQAWAEL